MSTDSEMYPQREDVVILSSGGPVTAHYESIPVGEIYVVKLINGAFSIYRKTNLFDDELIQKVNSHREAMQALSTTS